MIVEFREGVVCLGRSIGGWLPVSGRTETGGLKFCIFKRTSYMYDA